MFLKVSDKLPFLPLVVVLLVYPVSQSSGFSIGLIFTGILVLQQLGYVKVDWKKLEADYNKLKCRNPNMSLENIRYTELMKENVPFTGGVAGGFFLALGWTVENKSDSKAHLSKIAQFLAVILEKKLSKILKIAKIVLRSIPGK